MINIRLIGENGIHNLINNSLIITKNISKKRQLLAEVNWNSIKIIKEQMIAAFYILIRKTSLADGQQLSFNWCICSISREIC